MFYFVLFVSYLRTSYLSLSAGITGIYHHAWFSRTFFFKMSFILLLTFARCDWSSATGLPLIERKEDGRERLLRAGVLEGTTRRKEIGTLVFLDPRWQAPSDGLKFFISLFTLYKPLKIVCLILITALQKRLFWVPLSSWGKEGFAFLVATGSAGGGAVGVCCVSVAKIIKAARTSHYYAKLGRRLGLFRAEAHLSLRATPLDSEGFVNWVGWVEMRPQTLALTISLSLSRPSPPGRSLSD